MKNIRIGTIVDANEKSASYIKQIIPCGFESFALHYGGGFKGFEPERLAEDVMPIVKRNDIEISAVSVFGDMLGETEEADETRRCFKRAIECAHYFETDVISGFTGRLVHSSIPDCVERFKAVWTPLTEYAKSKSVRIAFENCNADCGNWYDGGKFNIALNPDAWELMFEAIPLDNIGLQWEPCHQMIQGIDPLPQIREWGKRIFHVHGKDATIRKDILTKHGNLSPVKYQWHRTPGFGDSNWTDIISELRFVGYTGNIDIEGWHDPVYHGALEMTGQVAGLNYLKRCRGELFVPNPV